MIKSELAQKLGQAITDVPERKLTDAVNYLLEEMSQSLALGQRIEIRDFGVFSLHYHLPRVAHNPKTGIKVTTTSKYTPHFKPGKGLKLKVDASRATTPIINDPFEDV
jgi:integration host factor subunit beta